MRIDMMKLNSVTGMWDRRSTDRYRVSEEWSTMPEEKMRKDFNWGSEEFLQNPLRGSFLRLLCVHQRLWAIWKPSQQIKPNWAHWWVY